MQEIENIQGHAAACKLTRAGKTRWISYEKACAKVAGNMPAIIEAIKVYKDEDAGAKLLAQYTKVNCAAVMLLAGTLEFVSRLAANLQDPKLCLVDVPNLTKKARDGLLGMVALHSPDAPADLSPQLQQYRDLHVCLQRCGFADADAAYSEAFHVQVGKPYLQAVIAELDLRLGSSDVVAAFALVDARNPMVYRQDGTCDVASAASMLEVCTLHSLLSTLPTKHTQVIIAHFGDTSGLVRQVDGVLYEPQNPLITTAQADAMRAQVKDMVEEVNLNRQHCQGFTPAAQYLLRSTLGRLLWPDLRRVLCIGIVLPIGTAGVERTFSRVGHIKDKFRSVMGEEFLQDCLQYSMNGPDTPFVDGPSYEFMEDVIGNYLSIINDNGRFAPFAHYAACVQWMRSQV
eukprot:TRINITY_DN5262_c0_g1_i3.p2 TRINITY_DN5262_c0_g1~~TRINITY_DN5262_c0_g1_i3.p2  ORF type:complete len:401 (-),score=107.67 TRINITY_DN5262_c0_g1_i3:20-1222(-)